MSYCPSTLVDCQTLQGRLNDNFQTCNPNRTRLESSFFNFLLSAENRNGLNLIVNPGQGRNRTIELTYFQRWLESEVLANQANPTCAATTERGNCSETYTMDVTDNLQAEELITISDWREICESNGFLLEQKLQAMIDGLMRRLATKTANELPALVGLWGGTQPNGAGVDSKARIDVRTTISGSVDLFPQTTEEIEMAIRQSGYCDDTVVFGGITLWQYLRRLQAGCCSDGGLDIGDLFRKFPLPFAWDYRVAAAFGSELNENVAVQRGALQLLHYNHNEIYQGITELAGVGTDYKTTIINDPMTGFPIDFLIKHDCPGVIHLVMTATSQLVALPTTMFPTGDRFDGVTYTGQITVDNT